MGSSTAVFRYEGVVADAIVAVKVRGARAALPDLGQFLARTWVDADRDVDLVTWVPADARRRRDRGFDHAEKLAVAVARSTDLRVLPTLTSRSGRADQASLPTSQRRRLPWDAYRPARRLAGARVLLIDDVLTTGATAETAARALREGGAERVDVAVLARAGSHWLGLRPDG